MLFRRTNLILFMILFISIPFFGCNKHNNSVIPDDGEFDSLSVTDIDGYVYETIKIGEQWWMAQNLKVTRYRNGDPIPNVTLNTVWIDLTSGGYCTYNNENTHVAVYGRLYNWYAVNDPRNIAPEGWHVPTDADWQTLIDYLGGNAVAGGKMKETGTVHWLDPNTGATNESGFTAVPGGCRDWTGHFTNKYLQAYFWSVTEMDSSNARCRNLDYYTAEAVRDFWDKRAGFSIRCVRD